MNKILNLIIACLVLPLVGPVRAAQIDLGITLGYVLGSSGVLSDARVELGTFSGYSDASGIGYFTGKDYTTLRASFTSLLNLDTPPTTTTTSTGQYYSSFDTAATSVNTRVFAWIFSGPVAASASNWAVISGGGTGSGSEIYNPYWLAPAPDAVAPSTIEAGTIFSLIYASTSGASIVANTDLDSSGANISLVPEPSTGALMMIGAAGLVALRRLRKV